MVCLKTAIDDMNNNLFTSDGSFSWTHGQNTTLPRVSGPGFDGSGNVIMNGPIAPTTLGNGNVNWLSSNRPLFDGSGNSVFRVALESRSSGGRDPWDVLAGTGREKE
jgi:hypothetical protein